MAEEQQTIEYGIAALREGSVDSITDKFGALNDRELEALGELEAKADKPRSSLASAIEREQQARALTAKAQALQAMAKEEGVTLYTEAEYNALHDELADRLAAIEAKMMVDQADNAATPHAAQVRRLSLPERGHLSDEQPKRIAFTAPAGPDGADVTVADLPELEFADGDFTDDTRTGGILLQKPITFPEGSRETDVSKVWLLDEGGDAMAVAELISPLTVGGGSSARIPAGHLLFRRA